MRRAGGGSDEVSATDVALDRIRAVALPWPEVTEKPCYGMPAFYVAGKIFARLHESPGVVVLWLGSQEERQVLLDSEPEAFFITEHYRRSSSVLARVRLLPDDELRELLTDAWMLRAPKRLALPEPSDSSDRPG
ncbi:MmcQ/YjbR family DNA-binding protein [Arthrobacter sp. NPDC090010]|uniref:MmcQ/YjbR family DNA-binding protein n=1 Tax=Arthrobacter sp. NPDC090010 TaxID=3363942 RepID=UPI00382D993B